MYVIVSWNIATNEPQSSLINEQLLRCLVGFKSTRPLNTFYIVKLHTETDRPAIVGHLLAAQQDAAVPITFVVSPAFKGQQENPGSDDQWDAVLSGPDAVDDLLSATG